MIVPIGELVTSSAVPETTYLRSYASPSPSISRMDSEDEKANMEFQSDSVPPVPVKKTYKQELSFYNGIYPSKASVLTLLARPFIACVTPVTLWAGLLFGIAFSWLGLIATSVAQIFSAPRRSPTVTNNILLYMLMALARSSISFLSHGSWSYL